MTKSAEELEIENRILKEILAKQGNVSVNSRPANPEMDKTFGAINQTYKNFSKVLWWFIKAAIIIFILLVITGLGRGAPV